jgi:hypothetical protein
MRVWLPSLVPTTSLKGHSPCTFALPENSLRLCKLQSQTMEGRDKAAAGEWLQKSDVSLCIEDITVRVQGSGGC